MIVALPELTIRSFPHFFLSRFNASYYRNMLRGKRIMFIGDSLSRNQFESMLCLLSQGVPAQDITNSSIPSIVSEKVH